MAVAYVTPKQIVLVSFHTQHIYKVHRGRVAREFGIMLSCSQNSNIISSNIVFLQKYPYSPLRNLFLLWTPTPLEFVV